MSRSSNDNPGYIVVCVIGDVSVVIIYVIGALTLCDYYSLRFFLFFPNLNAAENAFIGTIPTELGQLESALSIDLCKLPIIMMMINEFHLIIINMKSFHATNTLMLRGIITLSCVSTTYTASNELTGNIPSELTSITTLTKLLLCENNLTGSIPSEFVFLTSLLEIHLCNNELTGTIPLGMGMGSSRVQSNDRRSGLLQVINLGECALL